MKYLIASLILLAALLHVMLPLSTLNLDPDLAHLILIELRLPRTLLVLGYGAVLGVSGAALQAIFANP